MDVIAQSIHADCNLILHALLSLSTSAIQYFPSLYIEIYIPIYLDVTFTSLYIPETAHVCDRGHVKVA